MAWYGRRRSGEPRVGARAIVVGLGLSMIGVLAIQTSSAVQSGISASRRSMDEVSANLARFSTGIGTWQIGFGNSKESQARIDALEKQLQDLQQDRQRWKDLAETMAIRMQRYENLLDLVPETQGASVMGRVVAEEKGPFAATRITNAGVSNGVREGYAARNENGLVGRVIRVGEYTSRILLVTDRQSKIPVMGSVSGDRALLVGDGGSGAMLDQPETPDKIIEGEIWVTSGDDGQMPLGVPVGRAHKAPEGGWRIELATNASPIDYVRLMPPPDFAKPEVVPPMGSGLPQPNSDRTLVSSNAPLAAAARTSPGASPAAPPAQRPPAQRQQPRPPVVPPAAPPAENGQAPPTGQPAGQTTGQTTGQGAGQ